MIVSPSAERASQLGWRRAVFIIASACLVLRLALLPGDARIAGGFGHDSAYITIVAGQFQAGHGLVNPASWLLFLAPASLPMPFHNANPLYPVLIAAVCQMTSLDAARAALAISAAAHTWLMVMIFLTLTRLRLPAPWSAAAALACGLFPQTFSESSAIVPDALCLALLWSALAIVLPGAGRHHWLAAGVLVGLAWLARSTAILLLPGLFWWSWRTTNLRNASARLLLLLGAMAVTISPWLLHTARTWGNPLRSDAYFYWIQGYAAARLGIEVEQYWRSLTPPPPLQEILASEPLAFARFLLRSIPRFFYYSLGGWTSWSRPEAVAWLLWLASGWAAFRAWRSPLFQGAAVTVALSFAALVIRGDTIEVRYLNLIASFMLCGAFYAIHTRWAVRLWRNAFLLFSALYWGLFVLPRDRAVATEFLGPSAQRIAYRDAARHVQALLPNERVISDKPYYYTADTGIPSLSPPNVPKPQLLAFLDRYQTRFLLLPAAKINYYYPGGAGQLAPEIRLRQHIGEFLLLERVMPQ